MKKKLFDYELNESVEIFLLIKSATERQTRTGKTFIAFTFQDTSGEMSGNLWDSTPEQLKTFEEGKVVFLVGKREEYKGTPQLRIESLRLAKEGEPDNKALYIERAPMKKDEMVAILNQTILTIKNPNINRIVRHILNKYQHDFFEFPAAKSNHHAFYGGLAYHTISMLKIAQSLAEIYPSLNKSLLYGGLILHDIGKVIELSGPTATQYTTEGKLIGHIVIINDEILKACMELSIDETDEDVLLLRHMVLSHHGLLEYGSPVKPSIKEAEVLHHIDLIDAKMNMMTNELEKTVPGEFSTKIWAMDNRSFYKNSK